MGQQAEKEGSSTEPAGKQMIPGQGLLAEPEGLVLVWVSRQRKRGAAQNQLADQGISG
jgi:hypothetical protein